MQYSHKWIFRSNCLATFSIMLPFTLDSKRPFYVSDTPWLLDKFCCDICFLKALPESMKKKDDVDGSSTMDEIVKVAVSGARGTRQRSKHKLFILLSIVLNCEILQCKLFLHVRKNQSLIPVLQYRCGFCSSGACSDKMYYYLKWVYQTLFGDCCDFSYTKEGQSMHY